MGRVYPLDTIAKGGVPEVGAHQEAGLSFIEAIDSDDIARVSTDVLILGSTASGKESLRSDVDILVVAAYPSGIYRDPYIELIRKAMQRATSLAPIEAKIFTASEWCGGRPRGLDPMFAQHLVASAAEHPDFVHGRPIHPSIKEMAIDVRNLLEGQESIVVGSALSHMQFKRRLFQGAYLAPGAELNYETMQRALEFPKSAARRILELVSLIDKSKVLDITDREQMQAGLREVAEKFAFDEMLEKYDVLVGYDHEYDELLYEVIQQARQGNLVYETWLTQVYPEVCRLAWELAEMWEQFVLDFAQEYNIPVQQVTDGASYYY